MNRRSPRRRRRDCGCRYASPPRPHADLHATRPSPRSSLAVVTRRCRRPSVQLRSRAVAASAISAKLVGRPAGCWNHRGNVAVGSHMRRSTREDCSCRWNGTSTRRRAPRRVAAMVAPRPSVAATKKRPSATLGRYASLQLAQSSVEMRYFLQNACVAVASLGNQPSCSRCVLPSPRTIGMLSALCTLQMHARATRRSAERLHARIDGRIY